jgi:hypothetical protein
VPRGVELETDPEATVVAGQPPRVQATAEEEAEAAGISVETADAAPSESSGEADSSEG